MQPTHDEILAAVATCGDPEYAAWVSVPGTYVLRPAEVPDLPHHPVWFVIPGEVPHPMSFYVARGPGAEAAVVTSGNPEAVDALVRAEPGLVTSPRLPALVFDLLRDQSRHLQLVEGSARVTPQGTGLTLTFQVLDKVRGIPQAWTVLLDGDRSGLQVQ